MNDPFPVQKTPSRHRLLSPKRTLTSIFGIFLIGSIAAACGSGTASPTTTTHPANAGGGGGTPATATAVDTTSNSSLGTILVDSKGFTLYRLNKDSMNKSTCTGACATIWPPLLMTGSGSPVAGSGVTGLGTINTAAGKQVTYHGEPLYTFVEDTSPGQVKGQNLKDTWGTWFVVVTKAPAGTGATTTTAPSGGGPAF